MRMNFDSLDKRKSSFYCSNLCVSREEEEEALANAALRVLRGQEEAVDY